MKNGHLYESWCGDKSLIESASSDENEISLTWQVLAGGSHTGPVHREPLAGGVSLGQEQECGEPAGYKELTSVISDAWKLVEKFLLSRPTQAGRGPQLPTAVTWRITPSFLVPSPLPCPASSWCCPPTLSCALATVCVSKRACIFLVPTAAFSRTRMRGTRHLLSGADAALVWAGS